MFLLRINRLIRKHIENGLILYILLGVAYILGIGIGATLLKKMNISESNFFLKYSNPFFKNIFNNDLGEYLVFKSSLYSNLLFIMLLYLLGLLGFGFVLIPILILIKGSSLGLTVAYLVKDLGIKGILISILGIYPQNLLIIPGIIGIGAITLSMSLSFRRVTKTRLVKGKGFTSLKEYSILIGLFAFVIILGSLIEGFISPFFLKLALNYLY